MRVKLNEVEKIKKVCDICNKFADDVYAISGNHRVDAKSIMGLLSLDLSKEIDLVIDSYKSSTINSFINKINSVIK